MAWREQSQVTPIKCHIADESSNPLQELQCGTTALKKHVTKLVILPPRQCTQRTVLGDKKLSAIQ